MGLSAFGALIAITLAFLAQSPRLLSRFKLTGQRLDLRAKSFTGYGLALLLLAMGFFLAGVPLDRTEETPLAVVTGDPSAETSLAGTINPEDVAEATETTGNQSGAMVGLSTPASGGASGAMVGLSTPQPTLEVGELISGTLDAATASIPLPPGAGTETPAAAATTGTEEPDATATRVPTNTPTLEPSPTPTPTPILVPTALIGDETSTLPLRRLPGGPVLVVLVRGDPVILLPGHSFHSGEVWREVQTVAGVIGWVQDRYLDYGAEETEG